MFIFFIKMSIKTRDKGRASILARIVKEGKVRRKTKSLLEQIQTGFLIFIKKKTSENVIIRLDS